MIDFKECAKRNCTNEHSWNLHEYHKEQGIERLKICLCIQCHERFLKHEDSSIQFTPYIIESNAINKGK